MRCIRAYKEYSAAMNKGDDGRPDFAARKACNYLQASVQVNIDADIVDTEGILNKVLYGLCSFDISNF